MLIPYQKRQKDEEFADQMVPIEKNRRKKKRINFQNKCVSSQTSRMKKEEGATVDSSAVFYPTFPQRAVVSLFCQAVLGSVLPWKPSNLQRESSINYHKCPNYETPAFSAI